MGFNYALCKIVVVISLKAEANSSNDRIGTHAKDKSLPKALNHFRHYPRNMTKVGNMTTLPKGYLH